MKRYSVMAAIVLAVIWSVAAQAQEECPSAAAGKGQGCAVLHAAVFEQGAPDAPMAPEAPRRRHLEQFRMLKLLELLDLNDEQEMQFLVEFKALRERQVVLQQERERFTTQLAEGLRADTLKEAQVERLMGRVFELRREYASASEQFFTKVRPMLTAEQAGRLVVFQERFEYELLGQVRSFRERRGPGQSGE